MDISVDDIYRAVEKCKGRLALAATSLNAPLSLLTTMEEADADFRAHVEDERKKFSRAYTEVNEIINRIKGVSSKSTTINVDEYAQNLQQSMRSCEKLKNDECTEKHNAAAYSILSGSPFASISNVCSAFRITSRKLDEWRENNRDFDDAIDRGLLEGEALARTLILKVSALPSSSVNTQLLKLLLTNVYRITEESNLNVSPGQGVNGNRQTIDWEFTVVEAGVKDESSKNPVETSS